MPNLNATKHGHRIRRTKTKEYRTWLGIKRRCYDPKCKDYQNWGGRGIGVDEPWRTSFQAFLADMGAAPTPKHQIDRLDPNKNYSAANCRWVTATQNLEENRRDLIPITAFGVTYPSASAACRAFGIGKTTFHFRINNGISVEDALKTKRWGAKPRRSRESYLPKDHPDRASA
jgi:hypothetical protein